MNVEEKYYWIWFSLLPGIGNKRKQLLLKQYQKPKKIYQKSAIELVKIPGIGEKLADMITNLQIREEAKFQMDWVNKENINLISLLDKEYPSYLKEIYDPPIVLYTKGNFKLLAEPGMGIVGCREASEYGRKAALYFSFQLAKKDITIISGLARGIDSFAHIGALGAVGKTIAVVGNGLDIVYPKENRKLEREIVEKGGCIVSEYPLGTKPHKMNFPARNRIISGLSKGILVIEAKEKSGTLITVDFAIEQGRDVFVIPGNINSLNSKGTNELIKQGAKIVTCYEDILNEF